MRSLQDRATARRRSVTVCIVGRYLEVLEPSAPVIATGATPAPALRGHRRRKYRRRDATGEFGDGRGAGGVVRPFGVFFGIVASHSRGAVRWADRRIEVFRRAVGWRFMRFAEACLLAGDDVAEEILDLAVKDISELDMRSGVGDGSDRYLRCLTSSCSY